jgi:hypothetical protein
MKWTTMIAIALVPALPALVSCSKREAQAAPPKTASKLPDEPHPMTPPPPAPDANAASRKPLEPKTQLEPKPPPETKPSPPPPPAIEPPPANAEKPAEEWLLSDEDAAIPTQEEAAQEAALSITDENADEELAKLEKELAEGGGG